MSRSDNPSLPVNGGWRSDKGRVAFWIVASIGVPVLCLGWFVYGLAFFEEMTEACKSIAADESPTGIGFLLGGVPLVVAHLVVLVPLLLIGARSHSQRAVGIALAVAAVVVASGLGIAVNELVWTGDLFTMTGNHAQCDVIDPP